MKIGIIRSNRMWRTYSRSNKTIDINEKDVRLVLYDNKGKEIIQLQKVNNFNEAKDSADKLKNLLGTGTVNNL